MINTDHTLSATNLHIHTSNGLVQLEFRITVVIVIICVSPISVPTEAAQDRLQSSPMSSVTTRHIKIRPHITILSPNKCIQFEV